MNKDIRTMALIWRKSGYWFFCQPMASN